MSAFWGSLSLMCPVEARMLGASYEGAARQRPELLVAAAGAAGCGAAGAALFRARPLHPPFGERGRPPIVGQADHPDVVEQLAVGVVDLALHEGQVAVAAEDAPAEGRVVRTLSPRQPGGHD